MRLRAHDPLTASPRSKEAEISGAPYSFTARASLVNRTHRVVRERAEGMQQRRAQQRSVWFPMGLCAGFVVILCTAIWSLLDQYDLSPTGIPDASNQMLVVLLWFLPVSGVILALVLGQRLRNEAESTR